MFLYWDILLQFNANQSLFFLMDAVSVEEIQQIHI